MPAPTPPDDKAIAAALRRDLDWLRQRGLTSYHVGQDAHGAWVGHLSFQALTPGLRREVADRLSGLPVELNEMPPASARPAGG